MTHKPGCIEVLPIFRTKFDYSLVDLLLLNASFIWLQVQSSMALVCGMQSLSKQDNLDLLEILKDRHGVKSTIISSQLPVNKWYDIIYEDPVTDTIMDRLVHSSYKIELN